MLTQMLRLKKILQNLTFKYPRHLSVRIFEDSAAFTSLVEIELWTKNKIKHIHTYTHTNQPINQPSNQTNQSKKKKKNLLKKISEETTIQKCK